MQNITAKITTEANFSKSDVEGLMDRFHYSEDTKSIIRNENLLPAGVLKRLHSAFPQHSGFKETEEFHFNDKKQYLGIEGFREINSILETNGIHRLLNMY